MKKKIDWDKPKKGLLNSINAISQTIKLECVKNVPECDCFSTPPPNGGKGPTSKLTQPMRLERGGAGRKPAEWYQVPIRSMNSWRVASLPLSLGDAGGSREESDVSWAESRHEVLAFSFL